MSIDLGELYAASRHRIIDLIMSSPNDSLERPCPATPEWDVHDVVAHCRGVTEDVRTGNIAGAGTDPWTAEQVQRYRQTSIADLLAGWSEDAPLLEDILSSPNGAAVARVVVDVHAHEADLRGALGRSVALPESFALWSMAAVSKGFFDAIRQANLPAVRVLTDEADRLGPDDAPVLLRVSRFELFRARLGRRSAAQVLAYEWSIADATPYLEHLFVFGPRATDLIEA